MAQRQESTIFADYFQFYIQDEQAPGDLSESWTPDAVERLLAIAPGCVGVGTVRNTHVPVTVEVAEAAANEDLSPWEQVNECSIDLPSGRLVIAGCTDYFPDAAQMELDRGTYRVRICYENLKSITANGLEGNDHYRLVLWPAPQEPLTILKQRTKPEIAR
jgi:hypothetical protein